MVLWRQVEENDWSEISTVGWSQQSSKFIHLVWSDVEHPDECVQKAKSVWWIPAWIPWCQKQRAIAPLGQSRCADAPVLKSHLETPLNRLALGSRPPSPEKASGFSLMALLIIRNRGEWMEIEGRSCRKADEMATNSASYESKMSPISLILAHLSA